MELEFLEDYIGAMLVGLLTYVIERCVFLD